MARNATENEFRTSKMAASGSFEKKMKISVGSEMARNATENEFRTSKMATKMKVIFRSEMARNARKTGELQEPWSFYYF